MQLCLSTTARGAALAARAVINGEDITDSNRSAIEAGCDLLDLARVLVPGGLDPFRAHGLAPGDGPGLAAALVARLERLDTGLLYLVASLLRGPAPAVAHLLEAAARAQADAGHASHPVLEWVEPHTSGESRLTGIPPADERRWSEIASETATCSFDQVQVALNQLFSGLTPDAGGDGLLRSLSRKLERPLLLEGSGLTFPEGKDLFDLLFDVITDGRRTLTEARYHLEERGGAGGRGAGPAPALHRGRRGAPGRAGRPARTGRLDRDHRPRPGREAGPAPARRASAGEAVRGLSIGGVALGDALGGGLI